MRTRTFRPFALGLAAVLLGCSQASEERAEGERFVARMEVEHADDAPVASGAAESEPTLAVAGQTVSYATVDGREISGYLAQPRGTAGPLPGIVVIHEWWGLNETVRAMTERLAGEGYAALAVDLYEGETAATRERAGELARASVRRSAAVVSNLSQAIRYLRRSVGASAVGTIGWCMGGGWSLQASLANPETVDATVIYYGRLVTEPERLSVLRGPVLGLFGADDRSIPAETIREFESALTELGKPIEVHVYEGANHAFANPSGRAYNAKAAEDAWRKTVAFFAKHLS